VLRKKDRGSDSEPMNQSGTQFGPVCFPLDRWSGSPKVMSLIERREVIVKHNFHRNDYKLDEMSGTNIRGYPYVREQANSALKNHHLIHGLNDTARVDSRLDRGPEFR
jgi:hypothetical protein